MCFMLLTYVRYAYDQCWTGEMVMSTFLFEEIFKWVHTLLKMCKLGCSCSILIFKTSSV